MQLKFTRADLAVMLFVASLPFKFIYTYFVARGILPAIQGLVGLLTYGLLMSLVVLTPRDFKVWRCRFTVVALVMLAYVLIMIFFYRFASQIIDPETDRDIFIYHATNVLSSLTFLLLGIHLTSHVRLPRVALLSAMAVGFVVLANTNISTLTLTMPNNEDLAGIYLFLGDTFAMIAIIALSYLHRGLIIIMGTVVSTFVLFFIGSRTSLYAFVPAAGMLFVFLLNHNLRLRSERLLFSSLLSLIIAVCLVSPLVFIDLTNNRMLSFLVTSTDTSWEFRQWQMDEGLAVIRQHPLSGEYASDYYLRGRNGDYIHSYLEIWRQFGILPFALFLVALGGAVRALWRARGQAHDPAWRAAVVLMVFSGIEVAFSRTWGTPHIFAAIGMAATFCARRRLHGQTMAPQAKTAEAAMYFKQTRAS